MCLKEFVLYSVNKSGIVVGDDNCRRIGFALSQQLVNLFEKLPKADFFFVIDDALEEGQNFFRMGYCCALEEEYLFIICRIYAIEREIL